MGGLDLESVWRGGGEVVRDVGGVEVGGGDGVAVTEVGGESATVFVGDNRLASGGALFALGRGDED